MKDVEGGGIYGGRKEGKEQRSLAFILPYYVQYTFNVSLHNFKPARYFITITLWDMSVGAHHIIGVSITQQLQMNSSTII
jgi:hypothetical protein